MAVATLALGIGATTALVTVVHAVLLAPLPFPGSRAIVQVWRSELPALTYGSASYARYLDWRAGQRAFTEFGVWAPRGVTLAGSEGPERVNGAVASASFFEVMAAPPSMGRWFTADDDRPGAAPVAVISRGLWQRRFQGSPAALGTTVLVDGAPYTVVGVAPASFAEIWRPDVWLPLAPLADARDRTDSYLMTFGRLRAGTTIDGARRALADLAQAMHREHPEDDYTFTARFLHDVITEGAARGLWVLLGATSLLLLIACVNVANLVLARSVARERDVAIRISLGASRARVFLQVLAETITLGLLGSLLGLGAAWGLLRLFVASAPATFPRLAAIALDLRVLAVCGALAMIAGVLAGLAPALHVMRSGVNATVQASAGRTATSGRAQRASRLLVGAELALALAVVTMAGLLTKSVDRLQRQDLGFTRDQVLTFAVATPPEARDDAALIRFHEQFLARLRALPGVTHASAIDMLPIAATGHNGPVRRIDQSGERDGVPVTEFRAVLPGYFAAMGIPILAGRALDDRDRAGTTAAVVVNEVVAGRLWPDLELTRVVGQPIRTPLDVGNDAHLVVGVAADVRSRRPEMPPDPEIYAAVAQTPVAAMTYVVRSGGDPSRLAGPIRAELASLAPRVAMAAVRTFDDVVTTATRTPGLLSRLSALFGLLASVLAVVGIYGMMAYSVAQRTRELAIRAAVGASRSTLLSMLLGEGAALIAGGVAVGTLTAWAASSALAALLFEVSATDATVYAAAAAALAVVALGGLALPSIRAARVAPVEALHAE